MTTQNARRDYRLTGPENKLACEKGLANAPWYACPIPRQRLKELMQRRNGPAIRDTLLWFGLLIGTGALGYFTWGTWWAVPAFAAYGLLYGTACDSRWHECGHGTAFKTRWMNELVYHLGTFMVLREPIPWRWSHARHHTDTIIVGRDPEIAAPRPPDLRGIALDFLRLKSGPRELWKVLQHCFGRLTPAERDYVPAGEERAVFWTARIYIAIYAGVITWALAIHSILPLMYVGLPSFYGAWLQQVFGLTQHAGLAEDVLDHRLNCRTVYLNPVFRYLYWNMNYHVEHHMFPMVPYHNLPRLHEELKADMPPAYNGLWEAYREIVPALLRQARDPAYYVTRSLPSARETSPLAAGAPAPAALQGGAA